MLGPLSNKRGDTLVEVVLAIAALSAVLFISWSTVNKSSQISLAARQRIVMVNALKEQAEILQAKYATPMNRPVITANTNGTIATGGLPLLTSDVLVSAEPCGVTRDAVSNSPAPGLSAFHFDSTATPVQGVRTEVGNYRDSYIWVQKKLGPSGDYVDYYLRACWRTINSGQSEDNSQIVVRFNR